jgi:Transcriptional regulators
LQKRNIKTLLFMGTKMLCGRVKELKDISVKLQKLGGNYYYFETEVLNEEDWNSGHIELDAWLLSLPKPIGLFACDDSFALQVSEICKITNINIPNEISLLGVDNDELICNLSDPPISSICF